MRPPFIEDDFHAVMWSLDISRLGSMPRTPRASSRHMEMDGLTEDDLFLPTEEERARIRNGAADHIAREEKQRVLDLLPEVLRFEVMRMSVILSLIAWISQRRCCKLPNEPAGISHSFLIHM